MTTAQPGCGAVSVSTAWLYILQPALPARHCCCWCCVDTANSAIELQDMPVSCFSGRCTIHKRGCASVCWTGRISVLSWVCQAAEGLHKIHRVVWWQSTAAACCMILLLPAFHSHLPSAQLLLQQPEADVQKEPSGLRPVSTQQTQGRGLGLGFGLKVGVGVRILAMLGLSLLPL
jgi:hypothetical protein